MKRIATVLLIICCALATLSFAACSKSEENISNYDIYVSYDEEAGQVTGTVKLDYYNSTDNEINCLKFNLYGNAFREDAKLKPVSDTYKARAYYAGASYGKMEISNVENCAGWDIGGEDENILSVNLLAPLYPEDNVQVTISYSLTLAKVNHRTGITAHTVNLGNFYPVLCAYSTEGFKECPYYYCGDPFVSECANYSVTIDLPAEYVAASSGKLASESETDGRKKCAYTLDNARDFAFVLSKDFKVVSQDVNGVQVNYYYLNDANAQTALNAAAESLKYFSDTFGSYVYPTLSVVQTGFCYGGMEYPALTMIADGLDSDNTVYTIVHENAHQWWYAMVGSDQMTNAWQDEGLAEYSTLMFFENNPAYGFTRKGIVNSATSYYRAFFNVFSQLNGATDTRMQRGLNEYTSELEYNNITYNKGLVLFDMLRNAVGDDTFTSTLKKYYNDNVYKIASPENLIALFAGNKDVEGMFDAFLQGKIII
ncbi:MAG: M1 family metallopeptidase [Clostridia bacterium]|nr:M1 family metallopeptidase [Clostridia bacterium]